MAKNATVLVRDGGMLKSTPTITLELMGRANFSRILNMRREKDQLVRREGWTVFRPDAGQPAAQQYVFDGVESLKRLAELVRGDGTKVVVGASLTKIKYFDTATAAWIQIGSGFSSSGLPWQAEAIASVLILNNGVNLPQTYEIGDAAVAPLYEAREGGIASAGVIGEYNGFLFLGDIVEIKSDQLAMWMNGYASYTTTGSTAKVANFSIVTGDHRTQFNVTTGAGTITATLPAVTLGSYPFYVWIQKSDAGAGTVITSPVVDDEAVVLDSINDIALVWWNGRRWVARVFPSGTIDATDPYGIPPTAIEEHISDEQAWSDLGQPKNFAPYLSVPMGAASATINLPFKPFNWTALQTRVGVVAGGPDGGILGGQSAYPAGVMITAFAAFSPAAMGVPMTIEVTTDTAISYPRLVSVTRWTDISTTVGKQRLGNGSTITSMVSLNGVQVVSHELGFFINRWTGQATKPFALREKYQGKNVPLSGQCVAQVNNQFIVYPSRSFGFYAFDGLTDPNPLQDLDDARDFFFSGLAATDRIWAVDNPMTKEIWFCRPSRVVAYSYDPDSPGVSEIDAEIAAAAFVRKPGSSDTWFILGIAGNVFTYGLVGGTATTWHRNGVAPTAKLTGALESMNTQFFEKTLNSYTPLLSSPSPNVALTVQLRATHNANAALTDLLSPIESLPSPQGANFIPCFFQAVYWQDEIVLVDTDDVDFRFSGRIWEFDVIGGQGGITRSTI